VQTPTDQHHVNLCVLKVSLKVEVFGEYLGHRRVLHSISHPLYHIGAMRKVQGSIELHDYLIIPRIIEAHALINLVMLAGYIDFIEQRMFLVPHIGPINALHRNYQFLLGKDHRAVPIHMEVAPKTRVLVPLLLIE
jgi:hypothetical protein